MTDWYDYIIIGSGPGGSVMAHELVRSGARCLMLEAGDRYHSTDYPKNEMHANTRLLWNGGMDLTEDAGLVLLRGKVLGGGSVVNQCLLDRFDDIAWQDWREHSGVEFFDQSAMEAHYRAIEEAIQLKSIPRDHWNRNASLYVEGFEKCGYHWAPLRRGQSRCTPEHDCIQCLGGCQRDSKQSMPVTFLPRAEALGLRIETGCEVRTIHSSSSHVVVVAHQRGQPKQFMADKVVMAAGTLGTNEILLRSGFGRSHPSLGKGFYCHPQFMSLADMRSRVDAHKGVLQAVKSDDETFRAQGFKLENVFAGPIAVAMLKQGGGFAHQAGMERYRELACIEVAVRDVTPGVLTLKSDGRLSIQKRLGSEDWKRARAGQQAIQAIFDAVGAQGVEHSPLKIGLHLMGGVALGSDPGKSALNPLFALHHAPNVLVVDASLFPLAPGINPSLTIMALAHKAAAIQLHNQASTPVRKERVNA